MFESILQKIGLVIVSSALAVGGFLGYTPNQDLGATYQTGDILALFETTLTDRITSTATSLTLTSATDKDGTSMASSTYGLIIDEGTATEELILADCTGTACTNLTRGLSVRTGTSTVSALKQEHRRGASVKITDAPALLFINNVFKGRQNIENILTYNSALSITAGSNQIPTATWANDLFVDNTSNETIAGVKTFSATTTLSEGGTLGYSIDTGSDDLDIANKSYVDGVAVAGASDANSTTKGIVESATAAEVDALTSTGSTGAELYINPSVLASTVYATTTSNLTPYYDGNTTAGSSPYIHEISLTPNDQVMIWASTGTMSGQTTTSRLKLKQSAYTATTTLASNESYTGGGGFPYYYIHTATTTETISIQLAIEGTQATQASNQLSALLIPKAD